MQPQGMSKSRVEYSIHPRTHMGQVALHVASLDRQILFYQQALGFVLRWRREGQAGLGTTDQDLLHLVERPNFKRHRGVTGLYHLAVVFPDRGELARAVVRLFSLRYPNAPTDHIQTKSTYLNDPEGNGIELYAESPEDGTFAIESDHFTARRTDGTLSDGREPLDLEALFGLLQEDDRLDLDLPAGTRLGHVHLHVRDVDEALDFYHGVLGFDVMGCSPSFQVAFVSAGGYHHHIGLNTWQGQGAPQPPQDALGLVSFSVLLPDRDELTALTARVGQAGLPSQTTEAGLLVRDPSDNGVLLTAADPRAPDAPGVSS